MSSRIKLYVPEACGWGFLFLFWCACLTVAAQAQESTQKDAQHQAQIQSRRQADPPRRVHFDTRQAAQPRAEASVEASELANDTPRLKFFFFDEDQVDWVVSSDKEAFTKHVQDNQQSQRMVSSLHKAVRGPEPVDQARANVADWIAERRTRSGQQWGDDARSRKAERIVAYLRAHDFSVRNLTEALKRRTGASAVDLVAIHQMNDRGQDEYKLKVVLENPTVDMGRKGFNIDLQSANASYVPVIYSLGVALDEVQERINSNMPTEALPEPNLLGRRETSESQQPATGRPAPQSPEVEIQRVIYEFE